MNRSFTLKLAVACLALGLATVSYALTFDDLRPDAPTCKQTKTKRPQLPADTERYYADALRLDFNGDGWCDYAVAVPYPANSQMPAYGIEELMILGGKKKWRRVLHGKVALNRSLYSNEQWPTFRLDLTDIHLVYPKVVGAPFVLGLSDTGTGGSWQSSPSPPHCKEYSSVYRWDEAVGTFRRVDEATAREVIDYFYERVASPCQNANPCGALECSRRRAPNPSAVPSADK